MGELLVPVVILFGLLSVLMAVIMLAKNYIKVPPEKAAVVYGRTYKVKVGEETRERGFRIIKGGAAFALPFFEKVSWLDLSLMTISLRVMEVPSKEGVPVNVDAIVNIKIAGTDSGLEKAAEQFGSKNQKEIEDTIRETMEGHLRAIVGKLTPEELYRDRQRFSQEVQMASADDISSMGFEIVAFPVKDVRDSEGYIVALGKKRVAEVKKDAAIGEAEAKQVEMEKTSEAERKGKEAKLANDEAVAKAERDLAMKVAEFKKETDAAQAEADQAGPLARAQAIKGVKQAEVAAEEAETEARIGLAEKEAQRMEKELVATQIKPAEAAKEKAIIEAKGKEAAATHESAAIKTLADANREKVEKEGKGQAVAIQVKGEAEAASTKAKLLATAEGDKASLLAKAEGEEAMLMAEARGKSELATALAKLDDTGKLLQILEQAPTVAEAIGNAMAKALGPDGLADVFGKIAEPMGNIQDIRILDMGGGGAQGGNNPVAKMAGVAPAIFFNFLAQMKAHGLGDLLGKFGLNSKLVEDFMSDMATQATGSGEAEGGISEEVKNVLEVLKGKGINLNDIKEIMENPDLDKFLALTKRFATREEETETEEEGVTREEEDTE